MKVIQTHLRNRLLNAARFILPIAASVLLVLCLLSFLNALCIKYYPTGSFKPETFRIYFVSPEVHLIFLTELFMLVASLSLLIKPRLVISRGVAYAMVILMLAIALLFILGLEWLALGLFFLAVLFAAIFLVKRVGLSGRTFELLILTLFLLEAISLLSWIFHPFLDQPDILEGLRLAWLRFSSVWEVLNPLIVILLMFSWLILALKLKLGGADSLMLRVKVGSRTLIVKLNSLEKIFSGGVEDLNLPAIYVNMMLLSSILLSIFLAWYPYAPRINPAGNPVSVDVKPYTEIMSEMIGLPTPLASIEWVFRRQERSVYLLSLYFLYRLLNVEIASIVKYSPVFISPILVLGTYLLMKQTCKNRAVASLSALFAVCSISTVVGMAAGFFANWLALGMAYLALMFLSRFLESRRIPDALFSIVLFILVLLTHPWTWMLLMGVLLTHVVITYIRRLLLREELDSKSESTAVVPIVLINFLFDLFRSLILNRFSGTYVASATVRIGFSNLMLLSQNLSFALRSYVFGFSNNFLIFASALIGSLALINRKDFFSRLLVSWLLASSIVFVFFNSEMQSRLIYDLPIPILVTFGSIEVFKAFSKLSYKNGCLALASVALSTANYACISMACLAARF